VRSTKAPALDVHAFLEEAGIATRTVEFTRGEAVFLQGDAARDVMYVQRGGVTLSVRAGRREVVVAMLGPGDFFGEGCLAGQPLRIGSATAVTASSILVLKKSKMLDLLHTHTELADRFIAYMLDANIRIEQDLTNQLFNHEEKRLARTLLLLARYGSRDEPQRVVPRVSWRTLAKMVGTTPAKVAFFMKRFKGVHRGRPWAHGQ
jgi:CRP-like cAMP-binding protein